VPGCLTWGSGMKGKGMGRGRVREGKERGQEEMLSPTFRTLATPLTRSVDVLSIKKSFNILPTKNCTILLLHAVSV